MGESIIKSGRKHGFTVLFNSALKDNRLSLKAKGLFAIMQSLPEDWEYTVGGLATYACVGKDAVRSALNELQNAGYLIREQSHDAGGQFSKNVFVLQDEAPPLSENPSTGKPSTEKPLTENPTLQNKDKTKERKTNTPIVPLEVFDAIESYIGDDPEYEAAFEAFLKNRTAMKKPVLTARAVNAIINRLRAVNHRETEIAMLDNAVMHNWLTVYPLKADERPKEQSQRMVEESGVQFVD